MKKATSGAPRGEQRSATRLDGTSVSGITLRVAIVFSVMIFASCGGGFLFDRPEDSGTDSRSFGGEGDAVVWVEFNGTDHQVFYAEAIEGTEWATAEVELVGGAPGTSGVLLSAETNDHIRITSIGGMGLSAATVVVSLRFPNLDSVDNFGYLSVSMSAPTSTMEGKLRRERLSAETEFLNTTVRVGEEGMSNSWFSDDFPDLPIGYFDHTIALSGAFARRIELFADTQRLDTISGAPDNADFRIDTVTVAPYNILNSFGTTPSDDPELTQVPLEVYAIYLFDYVLTPEQIADLAGP